MNTLVKIVLIMLAVILAVIVLKYVINFLYLFVMLIVTGIGSIFEARRNKKNLLKDMARIKHNILGDNYTKEDEELLDSVMKKNKNWMIDGFIENKFNEAKKMREQKA